MKANPDNADYNKKILWVVTDLAEGSGGQRTVFQNMAYLISNGYECDLLVDKTDDNPDGIREKVLKWYNLNFVGDIICNDIPEKEYRGVFATYYTTAWVAVKIKAKHKFYFIQDYEPWFFPMSEERIKAKASYCLGLKPITIGKWLAKELSDKFDIEAENFSFCADLNVYQKNGEIKKEDAICLVYQPNKPWRCSEIGLRAMQIIQAIRPDVKIYIFGSEKKIPFNLKAEHLGMLSTKGCSDLYNKCKVGVCMSATNPSRIPFEMMATGLPVVDLYLENNLYDAYEGGCLLAEPSAEAVATAVLKLLDDEELRNRLSINGEKYMKKYPLEMGLDEFGKIVENTLEGRALKKESFKNSYNKGAIKPQRDMLYSFPKVYFKSLEEIKLEIERRKQEEERRKLELEDLDRKKREEEWRRNLTIPQKIYLKIRYKLLGR